MLGGSIDGLAKSTGRAGPKASVVPSVNRNTVGPDAGSSTTIIRVLVLLPPSIEDTETWEKLKASRRQFV